MTQFLLLISKYIIMITSLQVVFEGVVGSGYRGDIGIDDIRIAKGECPHVGTCDFEYDTCGYLNPTSLDSYDWLRNSGRTATSQTGPPVDHTTNSNSGQWSLINI